MSLRIYLAGPLFTTAELAFNRRLAKAIRKHGHQVWLPQEHEQRRRTAEEIFNKDIEGIDWAQVVVANMDGPDPDSGTSWECGYAYRRKPIILFRTDLRSASEMGKSKFNLMLTESATSFIDLPATGSGIATLVKEIIKVLAKLEPQLQAPAGPASSGSA